jgi:hypothetical protein
MISSGLGSRANLPVVVRQAGRNTVIIVPDRSAHTRRAILLLVFSLGIPSLARAAGLEDSAKALAAKIAAVLPARENVSCEIRNASLLSPDDVARIDQALKAGLQEQGVHFAASGAEVAVIVTLSENLKNLVWTAEVHKGESLQVVLITAERASEDHAVSTAMPVTIRSEKFWEGPERILDAGEISNGTGKSWLVLLFPDGLRVQDKQTGVAATTEIKSLQSTSRDPWGNLNVEPVGNSIGIFLAPRMCAVNLETLDFSGCLSEGSTSAPLSGRVPVNFDIAPGGPPPPGKGTMIEIHPVCGGAGQFLATGGRDYTQKDSVQMFEIKAGGGTAASAVAVSAELDFPGPLMALHATSATPRAVVRNLTTGNYEAYRLSFTCGQ